MRTPKTYRLERIADFLEVPADRRETLFEELVTVLTTADAILDAVRRSALELGLEVPEPAGVINAVTWTDDGKQELTFDLSVAEVET